MRGFFGTVRHATPPSKQHKRPTPTGDQCGTGVAVAPARDRHPLETHRGGPQFALEMFRVLLAAVLIIPLLGKEEPAISAGNLVWMLTPPF